MVVYESDHRGVVINRAEMQVSSWSVERIRKQVQVGYGVIVVGDIFPLCLRRECRAGGCGKCGTERVMPVYV